jgi:hypothetical protein
VIRFHLTGHTCSVQAGHSFLALVFSSPLASTLTPMAGPHLEHP